VGRRVGTWDLRVGFDGMGSWGLMVWEVGGLGGVV